MNPLPRLPMTAAERRREASRIIDLALRGGISSMFDDDGHLMRLEATPDIDPSPAATYERLCVEIDRYRREIRAELRDRLPQNGRVFMGTPVLEENGERNRDRPAWAADRGTTSGGVL